MRSAGAEVDFNARPRPLLALVAVALIAATTVAVAVSGAAPAFAYSEERFVTRVLDGDTIEIAPPGETTGEVEVVRFAGVNTNETGMCHAAEATARTQELIENKWITISADDAGSMASDGVRLLRFIDIGNVDVGLTLIQESLAFALPNDREPSRNQLYGEASKLAALAGEGIWDPDACGVGPGAGTPLRMIIDWDAPGDDHLAENRNGEYFRIHNDGEFDLSMDGWSIRDSSTHIFPLPTGVEIPAGGYLTVYGGSGSSTSTEVYLDHPEPLFNNEVGDAGFLLDGDDDIRAYFTYPCIMTCSDPLQGKLSITANWDAEGSDDTNPNGEWIDIRNTSESTVDLFDYTLGNSYHRYDLPEGSTIPAGDILRLYIGSGTNSSAVQYWGMPEGILLNEGDEVFIETYDQIEIAKFAYPCVGVCTDPLQGMIAVSANYDAAGTDADNPNGEWVNITNVSGSSLDLAGYMLKSSGHIYHFNDDPIHPGERLRLHIGEGDDTRLVKYWGKTIAVLGNTGDEVAVATYDVVVVDQMQWPCSPCGPTPSLKISDWQWDVPGQDEPNDEWIEIKNVGIDDVDLRDWMLRDNVNGLDFKDSKVIGPGDKLRVYIGSGTDTAGTMYWGLSDDIMFSNDRLELWTPHRDLLSCHAWGTQSCGPVVSRPRCDGRDATIVGTEGADVLVGTSGDDVIVGLGGNDFIDGRGGDDVICGGDGKDIMQGGPGNDLLKGNAGADTVSYADSPNGVVVKIAANTATGHGTDSLSNVEHVIGSDYADILEGDEGNNDLFGEGGDDTLKGKSGRDDLFGGGGADLVYGGKGGDKGFGGDGNDRLEGGTGADVLSGDSGVDVLLGQGGTDTLRGKGGDDELRGGAGADTIYGGSGADLCRSGTYSSCEL